MKNNGIISLYFQCRKLIVNKIISQEDLTVDDMNRIIDDIIAGKKPKPGPQ